jgi:hypothetical protein
MNVPVSAARARPVPFWNRLRQIALYPFRGTALVVLVTLTLGSLLGYLPGVGGIITFILWLSAYKFGFEILRSTADGDLEAPERVVGVGDGVIWRFLGLQFVFMFVLVLALGMGGPLIGLITLLVIAFMQPGCMMSLAIDGSFGRAIDPTTTFGIIGRIGGPYLAAFALLFVIQASAATAGTWVSSFLPGIVGELALTLFSLWGLFAAFHLMGYLVYQYHDELGYTPENHSRALPTLVDRDSALLEQAESMVRDGRTNDALQLLREEIRSRAVTTGTHELYRRLLRPGGDRPAIEDHARLYLNLLMMEKQDRKALGLLREALDANPDFVPMQIEHAEQLATRAQLLGQSQLALDQWLALWRTQRRNPNAPRWALDAALLLSGRYSKDAEARALLEQARGVSSDATLNEKIEAALKPLATA